MCFLTLSSPYVGFIWFESGTIPSRLVAWRWTLEKGAFCNWIQNILLRIRLMRAPEKEQQNTYLHVREPYWFD